MVRKRLEPCSIRGARAGCSGPRRLNGMARYQSPALAGIAMLLAACTASPSAPAQPPPATAGPTTTQAAPPAPDRVLAQQTVWVANEQAQTISQVDVVASRVVAEEPTPGRPHNIAVGSNGTVAATLPAEGRLYLLEPSSGPVTVALGGAPHDIKAAGDRFVVANEGAATLHILEPDGRRVADVGLPAQPHDVAVSPDGRTAWATLDGSDRLVVVDLEDAAVRRLVPTGASPHDLLFSPTGELWVTDWTGPALVLAADGQVRGRVDLGSESHHLAFGPDGRQAWITDNAAGTVFVVDTERRVVVGNVETPGLPHHVAISGERAAVADSTGVTVIYDVGSRRTTAVVPTGDGPHGVATRR